MKRHESDVSSEEFALPQRPNVSEMSDWDWRRGHGNLKKIPASLEGQQVARVYQGI